MSVLAKDLFILKRLPQGALTDHLLHEVAAALIAGEAR